ncbi:hypothetical protein H1220_04490 [Carnobacteriaceae bacterium zg-84]|uniref:hypothetical protein n=1 Tax=Granulicatella sp. zg-84 TaxID=2678503 RepID=UPI0013BFF417|nr:hypothetical protein [Granulicatella sp. zg-84]NEW66079.1 hypothetical protein [Granulicatella sp. zg-84]QMI85009.1 hypothetical protein H1220_04490 [Carnobacteriaceae bacterium zg-84]
MKLFSGLFKSRDKPENKLNNNSYSFFIGHSSSGKGVNKQPVIAGCLFVCSNIIGNIVKSTNLCL